LATAAASTATVVTASTATASTATASTATAAIAVTAAAATARRNEKKCAGRRRSEQDRPEIHAVVFWKAVPAANNPM
jgi:hypothetical protein